MRKIIFVLALVSLSFSAMDLDAVKLEKRQESGKIETLVTKVKSVKKNAGRSAIPGKTIEITESELVRYVTESARKKSGKASLHSFEINFLKNNIFELNAAVDFDLSEFFETEKNPLINKILKKSKDIKNTVYIKARVSSAKGKGIIIVNTIKINGIKLPDGMVSDALLKIGQKQNPPVDPRMLMPLPYGIQKIEILPGKIVLKM
ncbi:MAG: hypothetical protein COT16_01150 [Elusimicrobia bacterium CG08_land_8_20_14_0_20_44_26]|nr:MAG: hypothetical protein COT16_01150 [Elusimicrobia bacterium CG08_land_8_20_14_0_20_44_26]